MWLRNSKWAMTGFLTVASLLLTTSSLLSAGMVDAVAKSEPTRVESMARVEKPASGSGTFTCWQYGKQIFQSRDVRRRDSEEGSNPSLVLAAGSKSIRLMDFKNGLCILEDPND